MIKGRLDLSHTGRLTMKFNIELKETLVEAIGEEIREGLEGRSEITAGEIETALRHAMKGLGKICLEVALKVLAERYPEPTVPCPCGAEAEYKFRRSAKTKSVFGWVDYKRAYYICPECRQGQYPLDQELGLRPGEMSVALESLLALEGLERPFKEASLALEELLLIEVSENTVRKATQHFGTLCEQEEEGWKAESYDLENMKARPRTVTDPPERLYGSLDGVQIPVGGGDEWRELKCGCWYEVEEAEGEERGALRAKDVDYYCELTRAKAFRDLVWATGYRRLADEAGEIVFVADGAPWIWKMVDYHFPDAVQIVDWYHATEYLMPIAHSVFGKETPEAQRWVEKRRHELGEGHVQEVIKACKAFEDHPQAQEPVRKAITYYRNNEERMDYGRFRKEGYQIGSGTVESACKRIGTQRLKRAGARWKEEGAQDTAKARAAWLSGRWERLEARNEQLAQAA
jgi:hypothetical protein